MSNCRVTVAILSWNRLHYLRATLESAKRCIHGEQIEWIVSDNASEEPGLTDYLADCNWITHRWSKKQTHAEAMNEIVARAAGRYLLLWPEDMQFVVEGDWLRRLLDTLDADAPRAVRHDEAHRCCCSPPQRYLPARKPRR